MSAKILIEGLEAECEVVNRLVERIDAKSTRNLLRSAYYDGRKAARMVGDVIPPQYRNLALTLGWASKAVDGLTRRTMIDEFVSTADGVDLSALGLQELIESNFLYSELAQARTDAALHGVSYLVTSAGMGDEPRALVHAKSALDSTGEWNDRARRLDNFLSVTDRVRGDVTGFILYLPNRTLDAKKVDGRWDVQEFSHSFGVPVEQLVYKPRKSRSYGKSRITRPVMSLQDSAMRALLRVEGHMDIYAIPQMIFLGADESLFTDAAGNQKPSWKIAMGRAFGIPDSDDPTLANPRVDVKQFSAQDPEPHIKQLNMLAKLMARETNLPDSDFALSDFSNPTSGDSYVQGREDLITEAEGAQVDWAPATRRTVRRALAIQNGESAIPDSFESIREVWRDPRYTSRAAAADAGAKQISAVPWLAETRVGLKLMGLTSDQVDQALSERRQVTGRAVVEAVLNANGGGNAGGDSAGDVSGG